MNKKKIIIIVIIILILLLGIYLYYEDNYLKVSKYEINDNNLPKSFNNFKIVHISDFHNTKSKKLTKDIVKKIKLEKPNIIVVTGDLVDSRRTDIEVSLSFIKKIIDVSPIYYVIGNHETRLDNMDDLIKKLKDIGVIVLDNKVETIEISDEVINIVGLNDPNLYKVKDYEKLINKNLNNIDYDKNNYTILLSHRPELYDTYVKNNVNLVFTGHAHGGQIRVPFIGGLFAPSQGVFPKYTSGTFKDNNTTMVVSRGIGNSLFPFRVNNRPDLVVVTLNNK